MSGVDLIRTQINLPVRVSVDNMKSNDALASSIKTGLRVLSRTIHMLRHHIFWIFGSSPPLRQHVFSTKNKQKLAFSDPPSPPTSADVIYEWSQTWCKT